MHRESMIEAVLSAEEPWDVIVIGGGATGLGTAVDAASRGYRTVLLEKYDFAKGASSRSTKLVHGGVRYLQQGNVSLVVEALRERGILAKNAPHLFQNQEFLVPVYQPWKSTIYGLELSLYNRLAGKLGLGKSGFIPPEEALARIPTLEPEGLRGAVTYFDGQFDDSRLAITLAQTAADLGAFPLNYCGVNAIHKTDGLVSGVEVLDELTGETFSLSGKSIINATGIFSDAIVQMDEPEAERMIAPSQGVHLVLDDEFLPGQTAIMIPETDDGRIIFAVSWQGKVIVGTTDQYVDTPSWEPLPTDQEIDFLLEHVGRYLTKNPTRKDIKSVFAGLRPLVKSGDGKQTDSLSRAHQIRVSSSGLMSITGGKWTTYRQMAEDVMETAIPLAGLPYKPCVTRELPVHGWLLDETLDNVYGTDVSLMQDLIRQDPSLGDQIHLAMKYRKVEVVWAVRHESARTVEDILARRTRALLHDARMSLEMAPVVAEIMADELGCDQQWIEGQLADYASVATGYYIATEE